MGPNSLGFSGCLPREGGNLYHSSGPCSLHHCPTQKHGQKLSPRPPFVERNRNGIRMVKEVASYEKEAKENEARVQKMRDDGKDAYDIRKQEEV